MRINLCEIIDIPGKSLPFTCELEEKRLSLPAISEFLSPVLAKGLITNTAGVLTLTGDVSAQLLCVCDRCGTEFDYEVKLPLSLKLAADLNDEENPDIYPLIGNELDLSDLLETNFILNADMKYLCHEDCAGLCSRCGKNLNEDKCICVKEIDPRLAVLQQLLDK